MVAEVDSDDVFGRRVNVEAEGCGIERVTSVVDSFGRCTNPQ